MKIAVQKNHVGVQILYRSLDRKRAIFLGNFKRNFKADVLGSCNEQMDFQDPMSRDGKMVIFLFCYIFYTSYRPFLGGVHFFTPIFFTPIFFTPIFFTPIFFLHHFFAFFYTNFFLHHFFSPKIFF